MARLRIAAAESPLALQIAFMSRLRLVRRKWRYAAASSALGAACRSRNRGCSTFGQLLCEQRFGVAAKAADGAQSDVADDAGDTEIFVVDDRVGDLFVAPPIPPHQPRPATHAS